MSNPLDSPTGLGVADPTKRQTNQPLVEDYGEVPCTLLDTRNARWRERVKRWKALGLKSEVGRDVDTYGAAARSKAKYDGKTEDEITLPDASVFDPHLCELLYKWFCPTGGIVADPFAGGSVRGIVASALGFRYLGCELRQEQVTANYEQASDIYNAHKIDGHPTWLRYPPKWKCGDSNDPAIYTSLPGFDFLFSCPPYGDLEVYSEDPNDLSNMPLVNFWDCYRSIISCWADRLAPDRFAAFVVGNYRNKEGHLVDLRGMTVQAFQEAGLYYYNEAVLMNSMATGAMRAAGTFYRGAHKLVRCHQDVLVFVKGDPKEAAKLCTNTERDRRESCETAGVSAST